MNDSANQEKPSGESRGSGIFFIFVCFLRSRTDRSSLDGRFRGFPVSKVSFHADFVCFSFLFRLLIFFWSDKEDDDSSWFIHDFELSNHALPIAQSSDKRKVKARAAIFFSWKSKSLARMWGNNKPEKRHTAIVTFLCRSRSISQQYIQRSSPRGPKVNSHYAWTKGNDR